MIITGELVAYFKRQVVELDPSALSYAGPCLSLSPSSLPLFLNPAQSTSSVLVSFSSGLSLCNRKDLPVAVICLHGPCINFQMRKESPSQCPYSKSLIRQDKSPSGVLGFYDLIAYDPQRSRDMTLLASTYLVISYQLWLEFYP